MTIDMPLLEGLTPEERKRVVALFRLECHAAGVELIRQNELCPSLYLIESGTLSVRTAQQGELGWVHAGECLGEISLFTGEPASSTVTTLTEVVVWAAGQEEIRALASELPALGSNFCRILSRRLSKSARRRQSDVALILSADEHVAPGLVPNLAASVTHHLGEPVAVVDLCTPPRGPAETGPTWEHPLPTLAVVRAAQIPPHQWQPLVDTVAGQYSRVLVWTRTSAKADLGLIVSRAAFRWIIASPDGRDTAPLQSPFPRPAMGEWVLLGVHRPLTAAEAEKAVEATGQTVAALLPPVPPQLQQSDAPADWVLRHDTLPFSRGIARLARCLARKRIGIALGAGAGRGHALIWVLQALERLGVYPDLIAGTSVGACVGGLYASHVSFHEIELTLKRLGRNLRQWALPIYSLRAGAGLDRAFFHAVPQDLQVEDLSPPCAFVAADFYTGDEVILRHGSVWQSTRASASIPGLFPPMSLHGRLLIDGGVVSPVPCKVARANGSDIVIGVSLDIETADSAESGAATAVQAHRKPTWPEVLLRAYDALQRSFAEQCLHDADVPIRVLTPPIPLTNFEGGPRFVEAGERAVEATADQLRALMPWIGR